MCGKIPEMSRIRKIVLLVCFFLQVVAETSPAAPSVSALFVGNSLTQANDLPTVFKRFAAESPLHSEIEIRSITPGGALFYNHWRNGKAVAMLREQPPNFLILQGQSTEPLFASQNFNYYAGLFKAEADRVHATTVLLSTWARPASDPYYQDPTSGGSPAEMQKRLNSAYATLAMNLDAKLAPVGLAFEYAHRDAPSIELLDGTQHPSPAGTYLAAAMLFRVLFDSSGVTSGYYGGLPKEIALSLQRIASAVPLTSAP